MHVVVIVQLNVGLTSPTMRRLADSCGAMNLNCVVRVNFYNYIITMQICIYTSICVDKCIHISKRVFIDCYKFIEARSGQCCTIR